MAAPRTSHPDARRESLVARLTTIVGAKRVLLRPGELLTYTADGLPGYRRDPGLAVFPGTREETVDVVRALASHGAPFVARGAGTGLSGGALAEGTVLLGLHRLKKIMDVDVANARACVEPGVVNSSVSRATAPHGLHFAPDPSSQAACTIGGNVAENAGGPHCLKHGVTMNHVIALTVVLPDGEIVKLGNAGGETEGYDLLGAFVGSEGCFGVVLDATVKLSRDPQAVRTLLADFTDVQHAARAVSGTIATGIVPAALEMMDNATIRAVEASVYAAGYPADAAAVLLIELDGLEAGLDVDVERVARICRTAGARDVRIASDPAERARLWQGRKKAFGAMGRIAPHLVVQYAVVPRTRLPEVLETIREIGDRHRVRICNVFHAGDGNLHPNIAYDAGDAEEAKRVEHAMKEVMLACVAAGGTITGEHGVGLDKLEYMELVFSGDSLAAMCRLREVFDPERRANPGKVVPMHSCREWGPRAGAQPQRPALPFPAPAAETKRERAVLHAGTEHVRARILAARESGEALRIAGAGRWMDAGRPVAATSTLSLAGDEGIVDYVPGDLTLTARAGVPLSTLDAVTREHRQFVALDPFGDASGTLGATLATASWGPLAHAFGTPRDNVLGVEIVTGDGMVVRGGGRVVKNVAGFDLTRLAIGAWGTLGVITEATLRLRALPEVDATLAVALPDDARGLARVLREVAPMPLAAWALEIVSPVLAAALGLGDGPRLLVRLGGNEALVAAQRLSLALLGDVAEVQPTVWGTLRHFEPEGAAVVRLSTLPAAFADLAAGLLARDGVTGGLLSAHGTPSRGMLRCALPADALDGAPPVLTGGKGVVRGTIASAAPGNEPVTRVWERLPAHRWSALAPSAVRGKLSRRVLDAFDPSRLLNHGILGAEDRS